MSQHLFQDSREPHDLPESLRLAYGALGELLSQHPATFVVEPSLVRAWKAGKIKAFDERSLEDGTLLLSSFAAHTES